MKSVYYSLVNFVADYYVGGSQLKMEIAENGDSNQSYYCCAVKVLNG